MTHPNEERLRELYATFAKGDLPGFLAGCTDDVTFTVPGDTPASGAFTKDTFAEWIGGVIGLTGGTFQEHVLDVFANDDHAALLLHHEFDRAGQHREYRTAHVCALRNGKIATWEEVPGSLAEFESAWGTGSRTAAKTPATLMLLRVKAEPKRLEALTQADPTGVETIAGRGVAAGALRHRFFGTDDEVFVVDEWPDAESFQAFFDSSPDIGQMMSDAGVTTPPEIVFARELATGDAIG